MALGQAPQALLSRVNSYLKQERNQRAGTNEQVKSDNRSCKENINEEYDSCDEANDFSKQNVKCNPEDNNMYGDQDFEELGRRAERKIRRRKTKAREKKHNEEDGLVHKVWNKNEAPVTATVITFLTVLKYTAS